MANYFVPLAAPDVRNSLVDFSPVNNALDTNAINNFRQQQVGLQQQASNRADQELALNKQTTAANLRNSGLEYEKNLANLTGGVAQSALSLPDPAARAKVWQGIVSSHPDYAKNLIAHGVDPNDVDGGLNFIVNEAKGYQNPLDVAVKKAQLSGLQAENAVRGKTFTTTGHDAYGQPTYGMVDLTKPNGGIAPPPSSQSATDTLTPNGQGLTGADYLSTLPKPMADQVKAIAEGRMSFPSGFALKTPYWQQMVTRVSQYDPTFDSVNYNARAKTRNDFTSGKSAQNITSFNTAIGHLGELDKAIDGLGNSDYVPVNAASNATAGINPKRAAALSAFNTARNAVVEELTRAFKGTGGSLSEVQQWEKLLDPNASPAALKQSIKTAVNLLGSRIDAVGEQYSKGMGTTSDATKLLSPKAQAVWAQLNGAVGSPQAGPTTAGAVPPAAPAAIPDAAATELKTNPTPQMRANFDEVFGAGASSKVLGGS
jgi:hypothetical protein